MKDESPEFRRLEELLVDHVDGSLDGPGLAELNRIISDSPSAKQFYLEYMDMCGSLEWPRVQSEFERLGIDGLSRGTLHPAPSSKIQSYTFLSSWWVKAAVLMVFTITGFYLGRATALGAVNDPESGFAKITRTWDTSWGNSELPTEVGIELQRGLLRLDEGVAEIEFSGGASMLLEGPGEVQLLSPMHVSLNSGRAVTVVEPSAKGFLIETPQADVVNWGAELGIVRDPDRDELEVHAFSGDVEVRDTGGNVGQVLPSRLTSEQALRLSATVPGEGEAAKKEFLRLLDSASEVVVWSQDEGGNGHGYQLVMPRSKITWEEALAEAKTYEFKGRSGNLVMIESEAEDNFLIDTFLRDTHYVGAWIGLSDRIQEGEYLWANGEPLTYTNWLGGQPTAIGEAGQDEDYCHIWRYDYEEPDQIVWGWNDEALEAHAGHLGFIVEFETQ